MNLSVIYLDISKQKDKQRYVYDGIEMESGFKISFWILSSIFSHNCNCWGLLLLGITVIGVLEVEDWKKGRNRTWLYLRKT